MGIAQARDTDLSFWFFFFFYDAFFEIPFLFVIMPYSIKKDPSIKYDWFKIAFKNNCF